MQQVAALAAVQMGQGSARDKEGRIQVAADDVLPDLGGRLLQGLGLAHIAHQIDASINSAKLGGGLRHGGIDRIGVFGIHGDAAQLGAVALNRGGQIEHPNLRAQRGGLTGQMPAYAAAAAGQDQSQASKGLRIPDGSAHHLLHASGAWLSSSVR